LELKVYDSNDLDDMIVLQIFLQYKP
jgi:hypothetical protein